MPFKLALKDVAAKDSREYFDARRSVLLRKSSGSKNPQEVTIFHRAPSAPLTAAEALPAIKLLPDEKTFWTGEGNLLPERKHLGPR